MVVGQQIVMDAKEAAIGVLVNNKDAREGIQVLVPRLRAYCAVWRKKLGHFWSLLGDFGKIYHKQIFNELR